MSIPGDIQSREYFKFIESPTRPNETAIEVGLGGKFTAPPNATCFTLTNSTDGIYFTEIYRFYSSGTVASPVGLLKTITLYYSDSARCNEVGGVVV